ncbi:MAG TPA: glycosyltransferase family 4 protein [Pyrinomonadaceae bacterium]|nr:glycosyltransferase family 4 protein [Pyrinomonadaceae bacterium]
MKVLALVPSTYDTSPGQRHRIEQWEPFLRSRGVEITYAPFESEELHSILHQAGNRTRKMALIAASFSQRAAAVHQAKNYDLVYVFREAALLGPPVFERWIHKAGVPMVFDFDDAVFVSYRSPTNGYFSYLKFASKVKTICRLSNHVMAGNPYLADYACQVNPNVTIIPTTIDTDRYVAQQQRCTRGPVTIGWTGSFSTVQHLDILRPILQKLAQQIEFRLRVIGTPVYHLEGVELEAMQWRAETELDDLKGIDIGMMPLPDDDWSKGKCGLKALQFMALGIPVICSPVGVNTEIIEDGVNGFLASSEEEWLDKLTLLITSPDLRARLGRAGRETVENKYSAKRQAPRVFELWQSVVRDSARQQIS